MHAHILQSIYTMKCALPTTAIFIIIQKRKENIYTKKRFEANNKLMLGGEEERVKSNEAAISRFSSQVPNVVYHLTENVKFNQGDESYSKKAYGTDI